MGLLNWPVLFLGSSQFVILPLLWLNIAEHLGFLYLIGKPHFINSEFGLLPGTPFAWVLIVLFWSLLAWGLTIITVKLSE
jgi:hypothetical protein